MNWLIDQWIARDTHVWPTWPAHRELWQVLSSMIVVLVIEDLVNCLEYNYNGNKEIVHCWHQVLLCRRCWSRWWHPSKPQYCYRTKHPNSLMFCLLSCIWWSWSLCLSLSLSLSLSLGRAKVAIIWPITVVGGLEVAPGNSLAPHGLNLYGLLYSTSHQSVAAKLFLLRIWKNLHHPLLNSL